LIIRGFFGRKVTEAYIPAIVVCDTLNFVEMMRFLVDTGASKSCLSQGDALRYGIDYSKLEKGGTALGIGGVCEIYSMCNCIFAFKIDGESGFHRIRLNKVGVLKNSSTNSEMKKRVMVLPSLLGRDVLDKFELIRRKDTLILLK